MKTSLLLLLFLVAPLLSPTFARVQSEPCPEATGGSAKGATCRETTVKATDPANKKPVPAPKNFRLPPATLRM